MKKTTLFVCAMLFASLVMGGNEKYFKKMGETLQGFNTCTTMKDFQELANRFGVIGKVETGEWLPLYYEAQCYILIGFMGQLTDEVRDSYLDKASSLIDKMKVLAPNEAEIMVLEAFKLTGSLLVNPPQRSMSTSPMIHSTLGRALTSEPNNPRAIFMRISNELGMAQYFGSETAPLCEEARILLENWDSYEPKSPIHPNWGKDQALGIVEGCGE
jgi:hypothetical protein